MGNFLYAYEILGGQNPHVHRISLLLCILDTQSQKAIACSIFWSECLSFDNDLSYDVRFGTSAWYLRGFAFWSRPDPQLRQTPSEARGMAGEVLVTPV